MPLRGRVVLLTGASRRIAIGGRGGRVEHVSADLAAPDAPARLVDAACRAFGHLDAVIANHARSSAQALEDLTVEEIDLSYAVNTRATLLLVQAFAARNPGGRWSTPADTARLVAWLISDEANWITGQVIASDGGWSAAG